jgi:hypothetical protein
MKNISKFFLFALVTTLAGCLKEPIKGEPAPQLPPLQQPIEAVQLEEPELIALSDLPIPLGFELVDYKEHSPLTYCCYQGSLALEKIEDFMRLDVERNGWHLENLATPQCQTYLITKPGKTATIMHERKGFKSLLHINLKM